MGNNETKACSTDTTDAKPGDNKAGGSDLMNIEESIDKLGTKFNLSQDKIAALKVVDDYDQMEMKQGELVYEDGDVGTRFFIINKGKVSITTAGGGTKVLEAGDTFGEEVLVGKNGARKATVKCIEDSEFYAKVVQKQRKQRKAVLAAVNDEDDQPEGPTDKSRDTVEWLLKCTNDNLMFMGLDRPQKEAIIKKMYLQRFKKNHKIIKQGATDAKTFYVIVKGTCDIYVSGKKVVTFAQGKCFGELALLYDAPRAADVVAAEACECWVVKRGAFRTALKSQVLAEGSKNTKFLRSIENFKTLSHSELQKIADALEERVARPDEVIIKQGDKGDRFYMIKSGSAKWIKRGADGQEQSGAMGMGQYFGERALVKKEVRAADVVAKTQMRLLTLSKKDFELLIGNAEEIFARKIDSYNQVQRRNTIYDKKDSSICKLHEFKTIGVLGKGAFGIVTLVLDPHTKKSYANKGIKKCQIVDLGQQSHIINEKKIMEKLNNPFLVNLRNTYRDKLRVYFLLDVCLGGELFTILRRRRYFQEDTAKFFAGCVIEAFAYMHSKNIIYRDLKPENLVLDSNGYLRVTDFGFAKEIEDKTFTLCGTPDYLAPEIVTGQGHGKGVDWWTLGILIYEMLASFPPFYDENTLETYRKIIKGKIKFPRYFSPEIKDLIKGLLRSKPVKRLGIVRGGPDMIRKHPWYHTTKFNWRALQAFKMKAPIKVKVRSAADLGNFEHIAMEKDDATPVDPKDDFDEEFGEK